MITAADIATPRQSLRLLVEQCATHEATGDALVAVADQWVEQMSSDELEKFYGKAVLAMDACELGTLADLAELDPVADELIERFADMYDESEQRAALKQASAVRILSCHEQGVSPRPLLDTLLPWLANERVAAALEEALGVYAAGHAGSLN